jgi:hypothetical protein
MLPASWMSSGYGQMAVIHSSRMLSNLRKKCPCQWTVLMLKLDSPKAQSYTGAGSPGRTPAHSNLDIIILFSYREHDELRYSLRSVLQHFGRHTSNFHLLTTDVGSNDGSRYGILPQWLDFNSSSTRKLDSWHDGGVNLTFVHHSQVFENLDNSTFNR